ncbi:MAG: hypothetical protein ACFCVG_05995 [Kineosporiaceae bacterium]
MPQHLLFEGPDLETLLAQVRAEHGAAARIVKAERVRTGGVAGFFARQTYELTVSIPTAGDPVAAQAPGPVAGPVAVDGRRATGTGPAGGPIRAARAGWRSAPAEAPARAAVPIGSPVVTPVPAQRPVADDLEDPFESLLARAEARDVAPRAASTRSGATGEGLAPPPPAAPVTAAPVTAAPVTERSPAGAEPAGTSGEPTFEEVLASLRAQLGMTDLPVRPADLPEPRIVPASDVARDWRPARLVTTPPVDPEPDDRPVSEIVSEIVARVEGSTGLRTTPAVPAEPAVTTDPDPGPAPGHRPQDGPEPAEGLVADPSPEVAGSPGTSGATILDLRELESVDPVPSGGADPRDGDREDGSEGGSGDGLDDRGEDRPGDRGEEPPAATPAPVRTAAAAAEHAAPAGPGAGSRETAAACGADAVPVPDVLGLPADLVAAAAAEAAAAGALARDLLPIVLGRRLAPRRPVAPGAGAVLVVAGPADSLSQHVAPVEHLIGSPGAAVRALGTVPGVAAEDVLPGPEAVAGEAARAAAAGIPLLLLVPVDSTLSGARRAARSVRAVGPAGVLGIRDAGAGAGASARWLDDLTGGDRAVGRWLALVRCADPGAAAQVAAATDVVLMDGRATGAGTWTAILVDATAPAAS